MIDKLEKRLPKLKKYADEILKQDTIRLTDLKYSQIPEKSGVYIIYNNKKVIYIGNTQNLRNRIYRNHLMGEERSSILKKKIMKERNLSRSKAKEYMKKYLSVRYRIIPTSKIDSVEHFLISLFVPKYND